MKFVKFFIGLFLLCILISVFSCEELSDFLAEDNSSTSTILTIPTEPVTTTTPTTSDVIPYNTPSSTPIDYTNGISGDVVPTANFRDETSGVSFDCPIAWEFEFKNNTIAYFRDIDTDAIVQVTATDIGFKTSQKELQVYQRSWVSAATEGPIISERFIEGTVPIYETVYQDGNSRCRIVSFAVGKKIYDFWLSATNESFDKVNYDFNMVLATFSAPLF